MATELLIYSASGVEVRRAAVNQAAKRLHALGFTVTVDPSVRLRHQRFAGLDDERVMTLHRVAESAPSVALACRGGYGLTRLLDRLDWGLLSRSVQRGTRWVGYSDWTAFQLALLKHTGAGSWHGPMATEDFGLEGQADPKSKEARDVTREVFCEALSGELEAIGFKTPSGHDGFSTQGRLWGGNLTMVCSLLGTPHWPAVKGGILFLEDVGEHPYRVERMLLQLLQAGVLAKQRAVLVGEFSAWKPSPLDRGYRLADALQHVARISSVPILSGLPFGHGPLKVMLPQGRKVRLVVQGRQALIVWDD